MSLVCAECRINHRWCVCQDQPLLHNKTRVSLIIHASDYGRASNTGRRLAGVLSNCSISIQGSMEGPPLSETLSQGDSQGVILYPGRQAKPLTADKILGLKEVVETGKLTLFVPDGNWNQAAHMMKRIPLLTRLPAIELSDQHLRMLRMRQNRQMGRMSTFEAVAKVLGLIEDPTIEHHLMKHYDRIVSRMLMMRGKLKACDLPT